jgi:hypothetical protein
MWQSETDNFCDLDLIFYTLNFEPAKKTGPFCKLTLTDLYALIFIRIFSKQLLNYGRQSQMNWINQ